MKIADRLFARVEPLALGRATRVLLVVAGVLAAAWGWASWAMIDEQIRAPGTVIVSSRSQVVQIVDGGVLRSLHVREGDAVKAGDLLAELDTVRFEASSDEVRAKVISLKAAIERLEAELTGRELRFPSEIASYRDIVEAEHNLYERRKQSQKAELEGIDQSIALARQEMEIVTQLSASGDASKSELLKARRQLSELESARTNKLNAYRQDAQTQLAKANADYEQARQLLTQRRQALESTKLRAPMSGLVKNVQVTTLGAVFRPGDELLQIVPSDEPLIIEARVRTADVAFLRKGLKANVKLDAYDYTVYGSLKGHVTYISPDTLKDDMQRDEEPYYRVHIQIDHIPTQHRDAVEVLPGMTARVEIITGERTVAQYLLKPLRRIGSEALVER